MGSKGIFENSGMQVVKTSDAMVNRDDLTPSSRKSEDVKPYFDMINIGDKEAAVKIGLIPSTYVDCEFNLTKIKENQTAQIRNSPRKFFVRRYDEYSEVTSGILSTITGGRLPDQSYIIGSPNGFGKTSLVNTCLLRMYKQGRKCAPYISLTDLAQAKLSNEKRLLAGITSDSKYNVRRDEARQGEEYSNAVYSGFESRGYEKLPINIIDRYSWSEYMNCDVLFCYFTDVGSKVLESEALKAVLTVRGTKGLPTIAMISTSLDPYKGDKYLAEFVWNEILDYNSATSSYDRVKHISCYKDYNAPLRTNSREE